MSESILAFVGLVILFLVTSLIYVAKKAKKSTATNSEAVDYTVTIWAVRRAAPGPPQAALNDNLSPQKITAEYMVSIQAGSDEEQAAMRGAGARKASMDFKRRFKPILGEVDIGAVRFDPSQDEASQDETSQDRI